MANYKTKGLECWGKVKDLRAKYYKDDAEAYDRGALRWEVWAPFYGANDKIDLTTKIAKQWKCDAAVSHLNRGCEGTAQHQMEVKNGHAKMGLPIMTFEGNMADGREIDEVRTARMIDLFVTETLGIKKIAA